MPWGETPGPKEGNTGNRGIRPAEVPTEDGGRRKEVPTDHIEASAATGTARTMTASDLGCHLDH